MKAYLNTIAAEPGKWPPFARVVIAALLGVAGCDSRARPWQGQPDASVKDESRPFLPSRPHDGSWLAGSSLPPNPSSPVESEVPPPVTRAGGLWKSCGADYAPTDEPKRDVSRLAMLCGPSNGMRPVGPMLEGTATNAASSHPLAVRVGFCYRIFGVAGRGVSDLEIRVNSVRGSRLAEENTLGRVAIVEADRPFCSFATEIVSVDVSSREGTGDYALLIYQLPTSD